ncbi:hypothetical protein EXU34_14890 [Alteromonas sp. ZYF713]|nr:hypothetical protein [Alteromonas sp. ZYF713]
MHNKIAWLLLISALLLITLVPGGPIENRDFSNLSPLLLSSFNLFLTTLGLGSLMAAYFVRLHARWALVGGLLAGISYCIVYLLDLARLFPVSPTPMPRLLELIELAGLIVSLPTIYWCLKALMEASIYDESPLDQYSCSPLTVFLFFCFMGIVGLIVAIFATLATMGRLPDWIM